MAYLGLGGPATNPPLDPLCYDIPMLDLHGTDGDPSTISNLSDFTTRHLEMDWTLDFSNRRLTGSVELSLLRLHPDVPELVFDASSLAISSVRLRDLSGYVDVDYEYDGEEGGRFGGRLSVRMPDARPQAVIRVEYATTAGCKALQWLTPEYIL